MQRLRQRRDTQGHEGVPETMGWGCLGQIIGAVGKGISYLGLGRGVKPRPDEGVNGTRIISEETKRLKPIAWELAERMHRHDGFSHQDAADEMYKALRDVAEPAEVPQEKYLEATRDALGKTKTRYAEDVLRALEKPDEYYGKWVMLLSHKRGPPMFYQDTGDRVHISLKDPFTAAAVAADIAASLERRKVQFIMKAPNTAKSAGARVDQVVIDLPDSSYAKKVEKVVVDYMRKHEGAGSTTNIALGLGARCPIDGVSVIPKATPEDEELARTFFSHHREIQEGLAPSPGQVLTARLLSQALTRKQNS